MKSNKKTKAQYIDNGLFKYKINPSWHVVIGKEDYFIITKTLLHQNNDKNIGVRVLEIESCKGVD